MSYNRSFDLPACLTKVVYRSFSIWQVLKHITGSMTWSCNNLTITVCCNNYHRKFCVKLSLLASKMYIFKQLQGLRKYQWEFRSNFLKPSHTQTGLGQARLYILLSISFLPCFFPEYIFHTVTYTPAFVVFLRTNHYSF